MFLPALVGLYAHVSQTLSYLKAVVHRVGARVRYRFGRANVDAITMMNFLQPR